MHRMGTRPRSACFGGQRVAGLGDQGGVVEAGPPAERGHDVVVDAAGADGGVGEVDQVVAGGFGAAMAARAATVLPTPTVQATDCNSFARCCRAR